MVFQGRFFPQRRWQKRPERSQMKTVNQEKNDNKQPSLCFSTWNVSGKGSPEEVDKLLTIGTTKSIPDIVCLQEANLPSAGEHTANFKWMCSGAYGSAVLVKKSAPIKCTSFNRICDQICVAELSSYDISFKVISCYIPPSTDYVSEDLWSKLKELLKSFPSTQCFILAGDFNAELGSNDRSLASVGTIGPALYHKESNDHGAKLKDLALTGHYKITSTYFNRAVIYKDFFTYKEGDKKSQRDFIIMPFSQYKFLYGGLSNEWKQGYNHAIHSTKLTLREPVKLEYKMMINSWNIQGASPKKVDSILTEQNLSIVCVQGLFLTSEDDVKSDNYTWYSSKKLWAKNVAIVVKKTEDINVTNFEVVSEFLCSADITIKDETINLISCYLPIHSDPDYEAVTKQLSEFIKTIEKGKHFILAGDFSTHPSEGVKLEVTNQENLINLMKENQNTKFLDTLAQDAQLSWKNSLWNNWERKKTFFVSHVTKSMRSSPHHLFIPQEWRKKLIVKISATWISNFENGIVCMILSDNTENPSQSVSSKSFSTITRILTEEVLEVGGEDVTKKKTYELVEWDSDEEDTQSVKVHVKEEVMDESVKKEGDKNGVATEDKNASNIEDNLSAEDVEKFKDNPPTVDDLKRLLPGFIIFYKSNKWSSPYMQNPSNLLVNSFNENNFGKITFEEIVTLVKNTQQRKKVACSIKWKGILLEKAEVPGGERNGVVRRVAVNKLMNKLGQIAYTVKSKRSFFNKGAPPVLMGDPKLNGFFKLVDKADVPTSEDVLKHIDEFFSEDAYEDLAFGPGFSEEERNKIKRHARSKGLAYRYFTEEKNGEKTEYIAVYKKFSPQSIKDRLKEKKEDPKYLIVPPASKSEKSFTTYLGRYESEHFKDEFKFMSSLPSKSKPKASVNQPKSKPRPTLSSPASKPRPSVKPPPPKARPNATRTKEALKSRTMANSRKRMQPWLTGMEGMNRPARDQGSFVDGLYLDRDGQYSRQSSSWEGARRDNYSEEPYAKRARVDNAGANQIPRVNKPDWNRDLAPLVVVWPITIHSRIEERSRLILEENFPVDYVRASGNKLAAVVSLPLRNGGEKKYCLSLGDSQQRAAEVALREIIRHSTTIKPNPSYLCDGATPNFIRYRVPCQTNPRTYIIVSRQDTGPLTPLTLREIFETFQASVNEEVFFDKDEYSFNEKMLLIEEAPNYNLKVRHFGDTNGVVNHHVCVYKTKPKLDIVEEVLKMRNHHPKYIMTTNRLPAWINYNVF